MVWLRLLVLPWLAFCITAGPSATAQIPDPTSRVRTDLVLDLLDAFETPSSPPMGRVLATISGGPWLDLERWQLFDRDSDQDAPTLFVTDKYGPFRDADSLLGQLRALIGEETWERDFECMVVRNGIMYTKSTQEHLDAAGDLIERLRAALAPRFQFDYALIRTPVIADEPDRCRLSVNEAEAFLERASRSSGSSLLFEARAQKRAGDGFRFGEHETNGFLLDVDAEIAQEAAIVEPVVMQVPLGHDLSVQTLLAPDGRSLALFGLFTQRHASRSPEAVDLVVGRIRIEQAQIRTLQTAFSLALPGEGGVLLRPGGGADPELALLLIVRRLDPPARLPVSNAVIHTGLFTSPLFTGPSQGLSGVATLPVGGEFILDTALEHGRGTRGEEVLRCARHPLSAVLSGEPSAVEAAAALLQGLTRDRGRAFRIEIIRERRRTDDSGSTWQPFGRLVIPCLADRLAFGMVGTEETHVTDHDVEVAQSAKSYDPVVRACFDGVQAVASVTPAGPVCRVTIALLDQCMAGTRCVPSVSPDVGPVWIPRTRDVIIRRTMLMTPGTTHLLGDGPRREIPGEGAFRTRISIRVAEI